MHGILSAATQPIVNDIWREKYRYRDESCYEDTCVRVIRALCANEKQEFADQALRAMQQKWIMPAGRILAGAGTDKRVTYINCFVATDIQDSMATEPGLPGKGIMEALAQSAYTQQMSGGIGMAFSTIRPRGALVRRTQSVSSGVLPFMDMWNSMCATISSAGARRGAMMGTLRCDHPDLEEFIDAKKQKGRLTNFNVSVLVTDAFMQAVENDELWALHFPVPRADGRHGWSNEGGSSRLLRDLDPPTYIYKILSARELWNKIISTTYRHAEPGVIFIDRVNEQNNLYYCETINASNPCGEQMLPANGACNLGHTNLATMVADPFTDKARFLWDVLQESASIMTRLLDNVLDLTAWPTAEQAEESRLKRRIGLGFTGLASALQQLGVPYGSDKAIGFTREVAYRQAIAAYRTSCELARERGPFPLYDEEKFCSSYFVRKLDRVNKAVDGIKQYGIRNGVLLSIAPTGTTSLVLGNVSSGIEPVFAHRYRRKVRDASGEMANEYSVYDYGFLQYCEKFEQDPEELSEQSAAYWPLGAKHAFEAFVTADQLTVEQHLAMAAAAQEWVDSAISKTINCPESMTLDEFEEVYSRAHVLGLKGCTTYRPDPQSERGSVLATEGGTNVTAARSAQPAMGMIETKPVGVMPMPSLGKAPMQEIAEGRRYRIKWPSEDCAYYVIITDQIDAAGNKRPFELFIVTKSERHSEWVKAFALMVTAIFRREGDVTFVVDELKSVFAATGGTWMKVPWQVRPKLAPSLVAAIGLKIEEHMRELGLIGASERIAEPHDDVGRMDVAMPATELLDVCYHCGARAVIYQEGCATCHACGRSDCE